MSDTNLQINVRRIARARLSRVITNHCTMPREDTHAPQRMTSAKISSWSVCTWHAHSVPHVSANVFDMTIFSVNGANTHNYIKGFSSDMT